MQPVSSFGLVAVATDTFEPLTTAAATSVTVAAAGTAASSATEATAGAAGAIGTAAAFEAGELLTGFVSDFEARKKIEII